MTLLYALVCAGIALRLATFDRQGGAYHPGFALLAYLLTVAAGWSSLLALFGLLPVPRLSQWVLACWLLVALLRSRGSVRHLWRRQQRPLKHTDKQEAT